MQPLDHVAPRSPAASRVWLARAVAVAADVIQVGGLAVTAEGVFSPVDDVIDVVTAAVLTGLVGWHLAFVPSFVVKLLPVADLAPTWTVAVLVATAGQGGRTDPLAPVPALPAGDPGGRRTARAARGRAVTWFAVWFLAGFVVGHFYLMPHLPPAGTANLWRLNWAGAVLGGALGLVSARTVLRRAGQTLR